MVKNLKDPVQFWQELKQRKVVRAMTVYLAAAFAILQAADMIFPRIGLPDWTVTLLIIVLGVGLIVVITLTWLYDITPEGIKKTSDIKQALKNGNPDIELELPIWQLAPSQSGKEQLSHLNDLYLERIRQLKKRGRIYNYSSIVVIIAVIVIFIFSSSSTVPFDKRDWIVITDFENLTDNPIFDKSLYTAFSLSTSQSRYINVFPRSRMLETLTRMELKDQAYIDEKTGREIAIREGINLYIVPSISEAGNKYAIAVKIMETSSGNFLKSEIYYAETEDQILPTLDKLSRKLRKNLGESRYNIAAQDRPLMKVTTSSLEALKQYTLSSDQLALKMNYKDAKGYFENALRIDSGFTAARASLGTLNIERFDPAKGRELLDQAAKSVDKLTERERLNITAIHAFYVENDIPKCIEYTKRVAELYPDDPTYHNNLGVYYMRTNKFEESLKEYKMALKIRPDMGVVYQGIVWIYLQNLVRIDSARVWADKWISSNPQNAWAQCYLGLAYISIDSIAKAEMAFEKAREIDPYFVWNLYELAHTYRIQERYQESIWILGKIAEIGRNEVSVYYDLGVNYQAMGSRQEAIKYFSIYKDSITERTKRMPDRADLILSLGSVTARLSDFESSEQMLQKAVELDSTIHDRFSEVLCLQGKITEALEELKIALDKGYRELFWLKLNPDWQILQNDVRFRNLLGKYFN